MTSEKTTERTTEKRPSQSTTERGHTFGDVVNRALETRSTGGVPQPLQQGRIDWSDMNARLRDAVEYKTNVAALDSLDGKRHESFGETAGGLAALITALKDASNQGTDPTQHLLAILEYVQKRDDDTVREELRDLKAQLSQPGGNQTLETIQALGALGMFNKGEEDKTLATIQTMQSIGLLGAKEQPKQPSLLEQVDTLLTVVDRLRPPQQPPQTFQLQNGLVGTFEQLFQLEELRDKRAERLHEERMQEERIKAGRSALGEFARAMGAAAAVLRQEEEALPSETPAPVARKAAAKASGLRRAEVECDHCQVKNTLEFDAQTPPASFTCFACEQENFVEYTGVSS